mmetsp:Transcript_3341/g.5399  ORF Transcript_3341/g.5399 Transcript_3341/m.5399 type:complete len:340 (-) Transcript_3341:465-1484(-)
MSSSLNENMVARFIAETAAPEVVARNQLLQFNGNYVAAKEAYMKNRNTSRGTSSGGIATLGSISSQSSQSDREELYAGGASSGMVQLGKGKAKNINERLVADLMKTAQEHGGITKDAYDASKQTTGFSGAGRRLGDNVNSTSSSPSSSQKDKKKDIAPVQIVFYSDGFVIDDGPLRSYTDDAGRAFMQSLNNNRLPEELLVKGSELDVSMLDRKTEKYVPPPVESKPFEGSGFTLGSTTSSTSSTNKVVDNNVDGTALDESLPTTSLQIRLIDGSRIVGKFNHSQTLKDVRAYIIKEKPEQKSVAFKFATTFPPKVLDDENQSLEAAGLLNSVIVQRKC